MPRKANGFGMNAPGALARRLALLVLGGAVLGFAPTPLAARKPVPPPVDRPSMPPLPAAVIDETLDIGGNEIKARKVETRMTAEVQINGRGPYRFLVDSGADTSVIGVNIARSLSLPPGEPAMLHSMTESGPVNRVLVDELGFGQTTIRDLELPILRERDLGGEGMIGIDALVRQRLMMDFEKRVIKIEDADRPAPRLDGEIIVTARLRRGQLILTEASLNKNRIDAVIDTGSEISIGNIALRDRLMRGNSHKFTTVTAIGVTGAEIELKIARVAELRLGSVVFRDVPIAFADVPPFGVFGLSKQPSLLIGTDLMEKFRRVSLDFHARKVRFQLRRCEATGITLSTAFASRLSLAGNSTEACKR